MKKLFLLIFLTLFLAFSSGCSQKHVDYSIDVAMINADYNLLVERYDVLRAFVISKWEIFSDADKMKLSTINDNVERIINKVDVLRSSRAYELSPADIGYMYTLGKQSYIMSKEIYMNYEPQMSQYEILSIKMFDDRVKELDKQMNDLMYDPKNADINYTLVSILTVVSVGLKLILPLLVP